MQTKRPYPARALMLWARCNQHVMQYTPRSFKGERAARLRAALHAILARS